jgi:hypothetical protein
MKKNLRIVNSFLAGANMAIFVFAPSHPFYNLAFAVVLIGILIGTGQND